jgi:AcrR family transcriptional regulator
VLARARIIEAVVRVVCEEGYARASVARVAAEADVSARAFQEVFDTVENCLLAALELGTLHISELISRAFAGERTWLDGVRAALTELLAFFDSEPLWARVLLVEAAAASARTRELCERKVADLTATMERYWELSECQPHRLLNAHLVASLLGVLQTQIGAESGEPLLLLLGPLMGLVSAPYLPPSAVAREVERGGRLARARLGKHGSPRAWAQLPSGAELDWLVDPRSHRARACVAYLAANPGASNREIAEGIGVSRHSQMSGLLARLAGAGLLLKRPGRPGGANAWSLTERGVQVTLALRRITAGGMTARLGNGISIPVTY